jgi:DNA-binding NarL/FixJ family response regulator
LQVNHKDGNKSNNFIGNLEWVTNSENLRHAREVLKKRFGAHDGEKHHNAKLDEARVREIRALLAMGMSQYAIAAQFGVSRGSISDIHLGRTWREP